MSALLTSYFTVISPKVVRDFKEKCGSTQARQNECLLSFIRENKNTSFGRDFGFEKIDSYEDFVRQVPIQTYEDLEPYIKRLIQGEKNQLTSQEPCFFATTSGTTGSPKFIPVTPKNRASKSQLMQVWLSKLFLDHPGIFRGKILAFVSPEEESKTPTGIPCGAESGHGYRNMPKIMKSSYGCPYEVYAIPDYDAKYYTMLRLAAAQNISAMYTCNPSTVILLAERLGRHAEEITRDIRDGSLACEKEIPGEIREKLQPFLKSNPGRAHRIEEAIRDGKGRLLPKFLWPELAAIACWKGGNMRMYLERISQYFRYDIPIRDIGYLSSEFRGSVPMSDVGSSGILAVGTNFYEFSPVDEDATKPQGKKLLLVHQLEMGKRYYVYVTTSAGLYRYDINDIVEVTDFYKTAPVIRFVQKGKGVVSFTGEKLYEAQVSRALELAMGPLAGTYHLIAAVGHLQKGLPRYVFLVEFLTKPDQNTAEQLALKIERRLCEINCEYRAKRLSHRLGPLALRAVPSGELGRYQKELYQKGRRDSQFKMIQLTHDPKVLAEFPFHFEVSSDDQALHFAESQPNGFIFYEKADRAR